MLYSFSLRKHLKPIFVFFMMSVATTIYTQLDTIMLGFMKDDVVVGYYNVATKIKSVLCGVVSSLGAVILSSSSFFIEKRMMEEFRQITNKSVEFLCFFSIPICLFFIFNSKESIIFLSGKAYIATEPAMNILMPTVILIGFTNLFSMQMLIPQGKENISLLASITGLLVNALVNYLLISQYEIVGASLATLLAELTVFIIELIFLKNFIIKAFRAVRWLTLLNAISFSLFGMIMVKNMVIGLPTFLILCICASVFFEYTH